MIHLFGFFVFSKWRSCCRQVGVSATVLSSETLSSDGLRLAAALTKKFSWCAASSNQCLTSLFSHNVITSALVIEAISAQSLLTVADRHFRGTFLGEEPGAARAHARDEQLQLLQIRVEDGEAACVCYCRGVDGCIYVGAASMAWRRHRSHSTPSNHRKSKAHAAAIPRRHNTKLEPARPAGRRPGPPARSASTRLAGIGSRWHPRVRSRKEWPGIFQITPPDRVPTASLRELRGDIL